MTLILGLNAYHGDSAACLIRDGAIVAAAEEERFRRIKHWAGFPSQAIRYCLAEARAMLADVDQVAVNSDPGANLLKKVGYAVLARPDLRLILDRIRNQAKRRSIERELTEAFPGGTFEGKVNKIEHHLSHLASCFLVSPFREASVVSVDGFGDFSSAAWGVGRNDTIDVEGRVFFPHSLGVFYQALTQYLGFPHYGDEYKVMGLAPYGQPRQLAEMRKVVLLREGGAFALDTRYFRHQTEKINYQWWGGSPHVGALFSPALEELIGPARQGGEPLSDRHRDIARSTQAMYEEAFFHLLNALHARHRIDGVAVAGGCGMNSVANGKIMRMTPYRRVYVQSAAPVMDHAYLGPSFGDDAIAAVLADRAGDISAETCQVERIEEDDALCRRTAQSIANGDVVGWFQGRMEWGPRALGNRSILCDPRRADMKTILNAKIKRRESFRPFAPSILREHVSEWFEEDGDVPFMMQVYQIRENKRPLIPAVTHVDGSGRLQTVYRETNPRFWELIEAFRTLTDVPMLLNTSFNENEPVVCRPEDALDCFLRTKMDVLVMGNVFIHRVR